MQNITQKNIVSHRVSHLLAIPLLCMAALAVNADDVSQLGFKQPKLIVQITIDQLRADFFEIESTKQHQGGFKFLLDHGIYYDNAQYQHANTFTAVGHSTLATGVSPNVHGIIDNQWFDVASGKTVYCTDDDQIFSLTEQGKAAGSPSKLLHSTLSEQVVKQGGKVYSISTKDRGAIYIGGKTGKAFWYDKNNGVITSSSYYYANLPDWVTDYNAQKPADQYLGAEWSLSLPIEQYKNNRDDRPYEHIPKGLSPLFPHKLVPHKLAKDSLKTLYKTLPATPFADQITLDFAKYLMYKEQLGQGEQMDFLAVSLSANDYIGHNFGVFSLEAEDHRYKLDAMLGDFIRHIGEQVGFDRVVFALSADHGVAPSAEHKLEHHELALRIKESQLEEELNTRIKKATGWTINPVVKATLPFIYLDPQVYQLTNQTHLEVETQIAQIIRQHDHIAQAVPASQLKASKPLIAANADPYLRLANAPYPERSGAIVIAAKPYINYEWDQSKYIGIHGTPYQYDTHVPLLIAQKGLKAKRISTLAAPKQLAPSLAKIAGLSWPEHQNSQLLSDQ